MTQPTTCPRCGANLESNNMDRADWASAAGVWWRSTCGTFMPLDGDTDQSPLCLARQEIAALKARVEKEVKPCPKCGANQQEVPDPGTRQYWMCGSYTGPPRIHGSFEHQSDLCSARQEIAALKAKLAKDAFPPDLRVREFPS